MSMKTTVVTAAHGVETAVEAICKGVLLLTGFSLLGVLVINVFVRYVVEGSVGALSELPSLLFPWFVMGGVVLAAVRGSHVAMQLTLHSLPPDGRRWLATFIHALSAVVFLMLAWYSVENTLIAHDEQSTILHVPGSVGYSALLLAFLLIGVSSLTALLRFGVGREEVLVDLAADNGGIV
ncbi:MAG: TRAP transporter small permease [Polaromonas sp.]|nr:TRAP transporter small permease [Polaromonas sp.]